MKLDPITANFLGVLAQNRRLGQLGNVIRAFNLLAAAHRGETTAEVTSAHPLSDDQVAALKKNLKSRLGRDVAVDLTVEPAILGGLVRSEEHTSELQSLMRISYAVFCLKKKNKYQKEN